MRRVLAAAAALLVLVLGYGALDVYDVAPGILTRDRAVGATPAPTGSATAGSTATSVVVPTVDTGAHALAPASASAPIPDVAALRTHLSKVLADPALRGPGVVVRDAFTGQVLLQQRATVPKVPASTTKVLTALAVTTTLDPLSTLPTTVVQGPTPREVVLVAGGDTMLARGKGAPSAVEGRAGLADLATQVATALQAQGRSSVTLRLDTTFARGPRWSPDWLDADVRIGYTGGVSMLGLAGQRAVPYRPAPRNPEASTATAFVRALDAQGITVDLAPERTWSTPAPAGAVELGRVESAPVGEVLDLAMDESDNALTETLARIAAVRTGSAPTFAAAVAFVRKAVTARGVDLGGAVLKDTSGLASGQRVTARALSDALQTGADGSVPAMQDIVAGLPVAGLTGTLRDRFTSRATHAVAGIARAKTGTLTGASAMAGTVVDAEGRVLSYVVLADGLPGGVGTLQARAALDRFVAALATCGCR